MTLRRRIYWLIALAAVMALGGTGLTPTSGLTSAGGPSPAPAAQVAANHQAKASPADIDPGDFVSEVDNEFFPLEPGTTFFYEGAKDGVPASDETYVTHDTKQILGVNTTVVHDRAFEGGVLVEDTFDWYAQDVDGNVWYFGEYTEQLNGNGNVIGTEGSWEAGVDGAQPGIVMEAKPRAGDRYQQEFAPDVAEDMARVLSLDKSACVQYGCFDDLLLTREWTPLEPGVAERKYYAEDVGFIFGVMVRGGHEHTELVRITTESPPD
ncbi:MAG TPA: hypothetical protein VFT91_00235 [Dehalococcoidia bacterium]|nr:hypothetical protein [Dehalococcoidia bacterium]